MYRLVYTSIFIIIVICLANGQSTTSGPLTPGYCVPTTQCGGILTPCSTNRDCQCLQLTLTGDGICGDILVPCSNMSLCDPNGYCSQPNHYCVNNTRCGVPVCYPYNRYLTNPCPDLPTNGSTTTTTTTARPTTTTPKPTTTTTTTPRPTTTTTTTPKPTTTTTTTPRPTTTTTTVSSRPECSSYITNIDPSRNVGYPGGAICDSTISITPSSWIRFSGQAGTRITTVPPPPNVCGTQATGWYSGFMPAAGGTAFGSVCYVWSANNCFWSNSIQVTNCGPYYVYNLSVPPTCNLRYCTV